MFTKPETLAKASRSLFEMQMQAMQNISAQAVQSVQHLLELNAQAAQNSTEATLSAIQRLAVTRDPQAFLNLSAAQARVNAEQALQYSVRLREIAQGMQQALQRSSQQEAQKLQQELNRMMSELSKNTPEHAGPALELVKTMLDQSNAGLADVSRAGEQALQQLQEQVGKAAQQFVQAVEHGLQHMGAPQKK
ncbi:phasin family protein [Massilia sp. W12]|uniref:phasin family protein n=1 Tax=Massilia sp. W12 TaxID=3126507 RepID=UPI0030D61E8F